MNFDALHLLTVALQATAVYLFIILAFRLFGKKELAQLSVVDLVFILLISNSVQNAMVGSDSTLTGGLAAATGLFAANYLLKYLLRKFPSLSKAVQGKEQMLIYKGKVQQQNLDASLLSIEELEAAVREHGVKSIEDVDLAILEVDGNISVLSNDFNHKTVRKRKGHRTISKSN